VHTERSAGLPRVPGATDEQLISTLVDGPGAGANIGTLAPKEDIMDFDLSWRPERAASLVAGVALAIMSAARPAGAVTLGIVADDASKTVTSFDADTGTVFGTVDIPNPDRVGDCAILVSAASNRAFVTNFDNQLWQVDLGTAPPTIASLASGIPIANHGEDVSLSPDGRYAVTCDGFDPAPVSVVDTVSGAEVATFDLGTDCNSVDVCDDRSVLVTSFFAGTVRRLVLGLDGQLSDTGESSFVGQPGNVACAPGSTTAVVVDRLTSAVLSFGIPGLGSLDTATLSTFDAQSAVFDSSGTSLFARASGGAVDAFDYASGAFSPRWSVPVPPVDTLFGTDQLAVHPDGLKLYVPAAGEGVLVLDTATGATAAPTIATPSGFPTGICLATVSAPPTPLPPPPNDAITSATVIASLPFTSTEQTGSATRAPSDPTICSPSGSTVWYRYTAQTSQPIFLDARGSFYPTILSVYTGSPGALSLVQCGRGGFGSSPDQLQFDAVAGHTYFIMVAAAPGSPGGLLSFTADVGISIGVNVTSATVSKVDGSATLQGSITCTRQLFFLSPLAMDLRQRVGSKIAEGTFPLFVPSCDPQTPTLWSATFFDPQVPFSGGRATLGLQALTCDARGCVNLSQTMTVTLKGAGHP
jgi:hypothetical protein